MIGHAFTTALLAAVASATAWKGSGARLIDNKTYNTFAETEIFVQINSQGTWLNMINDATWKFTNSTAATTEKTDIVNCFTQSTTTWNCFHFMSLSHAGEDATLSLVVNAFDDDTTDSYSYVATEMPFITEQNAGGSLLCSYDTTKYGDTIIGGIKFGTCTGITVPIANVEVKADSYSFRATYNQTAATEGDIKTLSDTLKQDMVQFETATWYSNTPTDTSAQKV